MIRLKNTGIGRQGLGGDSSYTAYKRVRPHQETAAFGNGMSISGAGANNLASSDGFLTGVMQDTQGQMMLKAYRDMYHYDAICGTAVDLQALLPFSSFDLYGVPEERLDVYNSAIAALNLRQTAPISTRHYLTESSYTSTLVYDPKSKRFIDQIPYNLENLKLDYSPLISQDPIITAKVDARYKKYLNEGGEEYETARKGIPSALLEALKSGEFVLDPLSTLHLSRRVFFSDEPVSYLRRCLPIYLIEKLLFRGNLFEAGRRQRANVHIACLAGDTAIVTADGPVRIDSLVPHTPDGVAVTKDIDLAVLGYDGTLRKTCKWHYRGNKQTVEVVTESGRRLQCTDDHRVLVYVSGGIFQWRAAGELLNERVCTPAIGEDDGPYLFDQVVSVTSSDYVPVYDLTMVQGNRNAFVANGILVHNCGDDVWEPTPEELQNLVSLFQMSDLDPMGALVATRNGININEWRSGGDFWKWSDQFDQFASIKMKALGISDALLSSESSYSNADTALTVLMESFNAYRDYWTHTVCTNRIFPVIALVHGFNKDAPKQKQQASTPYGIQGLKAVNDYSTLDIPKVRWHKRLTVDNDANLFERLEKLEEHGVPIPFRLWIAASGLDADTIINEWQDDQKLQDTLKEFKPAAPEGEDDMAGLSDMMQASLLKGVPLKSRDFGTASEYFERTRTGKKKWVYNQKEHQRRANVEIAKAAGRLADANYAAAVRKNLTAQDRKIYGVQP